MILIPILDFYNYFILRYHRQNLKFRNKMSFVYRSFAFIFVLCSILIIPGVCFGQKGGKSKITFYDDVEAMRQELLKHIPPGSDTETATKVLKKNKLQFIWMEKQDFTCSEMLICDVDFMYCNKWKAASFWISKRWQIAVFFENGLLKDICVSFGLTGP